MTYSQITPDERYALTLRRRHGLSMRATAAALGRAPSTMSRELRRNRCRCDGRRYYWQRAQPYPNPRRRIPRRNTQFTAGDWALVERLVREDWSPEQIVGRCARQAWLTISHETINRHIWADKRAGGDAADAPAHWHETRAQTLRLV